MHGNREDRNGQRDNACAAGSMVHPFDSYSERTWLCALLYSVLAVVRVLSISEGRGWKMAQKMESRNARVM